ncbi:MAG: DUF4743 domain-containing protein [Rhodospirillales bacterium]|nr:DUF4743 domain-containing protein [Rhodospirillales bacterium]
MSFLDRISECAVFDARAFLPLMVDGKEIGLIRCEFADVLGEFAGVFRISEDCVRLYERLASFDSRTEAAHEVLLALREKGHFEGWRDEPYPVAETFSAPPVLNMERAAVPRFGVRAYGVHLNGYVRENGRLSMWVARRSLSKFAAPGKLDQIVAGGQPAGLSLRDNLIKECGEEAGIPEELAAKSIGVSAVSYCTERSEGLRRDIEFIYDLELESDFVPENTDGEVESFELWPIEDVAETVRTTRDFKFNCSLVVIDFLIRHGLIKPDHPEYTGLIHGLRGKDLNNGLTTG